MISKFFESLFNFLWTMVGMFTTPISDFLTNAIPDLSSAFTNVNNFLNGLTNVIGWFIYLIPRPFGVLCLSLFLLVVISSQSIIILMKVSSWVIDLVKRIWIFGGK